MKRLSLSLFPAALLASAFSAAVFAQEPPEADSPPSVPAGEEAAMGNGFNPTMPAFDRYEKMAEKSPFEFELAKGPEPVKIDPFADLVLAGFIGSGSRMTVYLQNVKSQERIAVYGSGVRGRKNDSGFEIVRLEKGPTLRSTKVVLSKDGEEGAVGFNADALNTMRGGAAGGVAPGAPGGNPRPGQPGRPNAPGQPVLNNVPAPAPQAQTYQTARPYVPSRGGNAAANNNANNAAAPAATPGQQGVSQLLNNAQAGNQPQQQTAQPAVILPQNNNAGGGRNAGQAPAINPPRRRVVLPTN